MNHITSIENATRYEIRAGQQNFQPKESIWPQFSVDGFQLAVRFPAESWVGLGEWEDDGDWYDWNKLKGVTDYFSPNNRNSALIAWRWGVAPNTFQLTAYTNQKDGSWTITGKPVTIYAGEVAYCQAITNRKNVYYEIEYFGNTTEYNHKWKRPWLWVAREVGTWIGGENNSPGPYGGEAAKDMSIDIDFQLFK